MHAIRCSNEKRFTGGVSFYVQCTRYSPPHGRVFDLRRMRVRATIPHVHRKAVKCLDVGRRVVPSGSNDGSVKVHPTPPTAQLCCRCGCLSWRLTCWHAWLRCVARCGRWMRRTTCRTHSTTTTPMTRMGLACAWSAICLTSTRKHVSSSTTWPGPWYAVCSTCAGADTANVLAGSAHMRGCCS